MTLDLPMYTFFFTHMNVEQNVVVEVVSALLLSARIRLGWAKEQLDTIHYDCSKAPKILFRQPQP